MERNKIDQLFKNKLDRHSEAVSEDAWAQLQAQIGVNEKKRKPIIWYVAAGIALFMAVSIGYTFLNDNQPGNQMAIKPVDLKTTDVDALATTEYPLKPIIESHSEQLTNRKHQFKKIIKTPDQKQQLPQKEMEPEAVKRSSNFMLAKLDANPPRLIELGKSSPQLILVKIESEIIVEVNYKQAPTEKLNELKLTTSKVKSLASEFSLADLRSAKNELFASAFQFDKKRIN